MDLQQLLAQVTEALLKGLRATEPQFEFGNEQKAPYILDNTTIIVPPYFDGYMGFGHTMLWKNMNDGFVGRNCYGDVAQFENADEAISFIMEV